MTKLQQRIQAYSQGYQAYLYGKEPDENPYEFSPLYDEWVAGWYSATDDSSGGWE